jgi:hypothetical protein
MSGRYRNIELEIALLASVPGFFIGGIFNYNKDIVSIVLSSVATGVVASFAVYFIMIVIFAGRDKAHPEDEYSDAGDFVEFMPETKIITRANTDKSVYGSDTGAKPVDPRSVQKKGKKVDVTTEESNDDLFNDIYGK